MLRHSFIYTSNCLSTDRPISVRQFRLHLTGLEVEPDGNLGAMHYDPIGEFGVMVIVYRKREPTSE